MSGRLWVLAGVDTSGEEPAIKRFGPTSENPGLLGRFEMSWPLGVDTVVVVPVMPGGLLRVSKRELVEAIEHAESVDRALADALGARS